MHTGIDEKYYYIPAYIATDGMSEQKWLMFNYIKFIYPIHHISYLFYAIYPTLSILFRTYPILFYMSIYPILSFCTIYPIQRGDP